jgi:hypothetical protein
MLSAVPELHWPLLLMSRLTLQYQMIDRDLHPHSQLSLTLV